MTRFSGNYKTMRFLVICALVWLTTSCSNMQKHGADIGERISDSDYEQLIKKHTRHDVQYEGFYNKFELYATFINSETQGALLQKKSDTLQWDNKQAQTEREKWFQENSNQTKFFISLFIPSTRLNDLHKGASIWKIYLQAGGQRYEGRAKRVNNKLEDLQAIYPHHNRWSVPYEVTFPVPLSAAESGEARFVLTSTQGTATLIYSAK